MHGTRVNWVGMTGAVVLFGYERTVGGGAGRDDPACGSVGHGGECKEKGWEKC